MGDGEFDVTIRLSIQTGSDLLKFFSGVIVVVDIKIFGSDVVFENRVDFYTDSCFAWQVTVVCKLKNNRILLPSNLFIDITLRKPLFLNRRSQIDVLDFALVDLLAFKNPLNSVTFYRNRFIFPSNCSKNIFR